MNTTAQSDPSSAEALVAIVQRVRSLYSLPAIAAEVIELTSSPKVDARALKDCIEVDPALTAKILKVVNSSLFGLSREVSDLNQAIALLGTKPLKLLVLGFSLPENLFREVAREQLDWYWSMTLARAVAAREISEQLWNRPGDDAFLAGLLQDIGVLVLLGEFKEPYSQILGKAINRHADLRSLEIDSLGFDHADLSAALLEHWNMPEQLVQAITEPRDYRTLQHKESSAAELARILHLAELMSELVAQHRLYVLADLLEAGQAYCGLDKKKLNGLVASLQPKVHQLADVLALDMGGCAEYSAVLEEAHTQMSAIAETIAGPLCKAELAEQPGEELLADVAHLRASVDSFLHSRPSKTVADKVSTDLGTPERTTPRADSKLQKTGAGVALGRISSSFTHQLIIAVGRSRSNRQPLSVLMLEVGAENDQGVGHDRTISQVLDAACRGLAIEGLRFGKISNRRRAIVLPDYDRQEAIRYAEAIIRTIEEASERLAVSCIDGKFFASAGIATVSLPVKNFPPQDLIGTAERCLAAARSTGTSIVKSLEIY